MAAKCYVCGEPATGDCLVCGKAFCATHGERLCAQCGEQDEVERRAEAYEGLPSPFFFRGALAIAILAVVLEIGWDAYRSITSTPVQGYDRMPPISATPDSTPAAVSQPAPTSAPPLTPTAEKPTPVPPTPTTTVLRYTVKAGDSLLVIAAQFGISVEALQAANNNVDPTRLQIGQALVIPSR